MNTDGKEEPLIEKDLQVSALVTKTMTQQEADDNPSPLNRAHQEANTLNLIKTKQSAAILEMATKTDAQMERDDMTPHITELFI